MNVTKMLLSILILAMLAGCGMDTSRPYPDLDPAQYRKIFSGKKVFIDPGHGGLGQEDTFRIGSKGLTEEEANLAVALELNRLLELSGAKTMLSRDDDSDISLAERSSMAIEFGPDVLLSIHHNGTIRRIDPVNYPLVLFWGNEKVNPASYQLAGDTLREFERLMDMKGVVLSDFSVFQETGTHILRETKTVCPGILGEAGFFSDSTQELRLKDELYIREEAKAYYYTLLTWFSRGLPRPEFRSTVLFDETAGQKPDLAKRSAKLAIILNQGIDIAPDKALVSDLEILLDQVPVEYQLRENSAQLVFNEGLFPGHHRLTVSYTNAVAQRSMRYTTEFFVMPEAGEYERMLRRAENPPVDPRLLRNYMLNVMALLSLERTNPGADRLLWYAAQGFNRMGMSQAGLLMLHRLRQFYPQSSFNSLHGVPVMEAMPATFYGVPCEMVYTPCLLEQGAEEKK